MGGGEGFRFEGTELLRSSNRALRCSGAFAALMDLCLALVRLDGAGCTRPPGVVWYGRAGWVIGGWVVGE